MFNVGNGASSGARSDAFTILKHGQVQMKFGQQSKVRVVTAAGAVTVAITDYTIIVNKTSGAATSVNLPASPTAGDTYRIKDGKGDAATNNITITPSSGNIDGAGTYVLNKNYQSVVITYNGTQWNVISEKTTPVSITSFTATVTLTDGATIAMDASTGVTFLITATGNRTLLAPSNPSTGEVKRIAHTASGADRTLSLTTGAGGFRFGAEITALTATTSGTTDYIGILYNLADDRWDVVSYMKGF